MQTGTETKNNSTAIIKSNSQIPISEIMSIGKAFVESGMFPDIKSAAQAVVKIQAGQEIGIAPFAAMTGIHIIQGRPTIGAGLIASKIKGSGKYNFQIKQHDETICSIDFYESGKLIGNSSFDIAEAKKAGTKNLDKFPKNMLFARAISNGVKWYCPDVFAMAIYTQEELSAPITEDVPHEDVKAPPTNGLHKEPEKLSDEEQIAIDQWLQKINECKTVDELKKVYSQGIKMINSTPVLFKAKEAKKKQFEPA